MNCAKEQRKIAIKLPDLKSKWRGIQADTGLGAFLNLMSGAQGRRPKNNEDKREAWKANSRNPTNLW